MIKPFKKVSKENRPVYQVVAFNGCADQYHDFFLKEAEDVFFKSHTATHLYKIVNGKKELIRENLKRMKHPGAIALAFAQV